ncbi:DUF262 domain-containing protein [Microbacterium phyllosphaerae]|uniref:DUF262 domain-containing protein n=1 Tax=Microbacterium phyllosphaerae TaxID=124798 RepID=A0ABS4WM69_9MICO|nr:DUF262 domain-containing protein [Microbacterium phyllosphaerae]MBP2377295.1 hypothetical protein [Microbacterium phyllosphaerae]
MAIKVDNVRVSSVGELLAEKLFIPEYQRPYSWEPSTALQLVDDVMEALHDPQRAEIPYVLGSIILHDDDGTLMVVDGQQRLLTIRMMLAITAPCAKLTIEEGDTAVSRVWRALQKRLGSTPPGFAAFVQDLCQIVRVETDDPDEAFRVFDSQNYRGKPLAPHDLLKAHHLREMRAESDAMKAAVVETWESVASEELDRLFSTYLYRIARWSRGQSATTFTARDIGLFKGISARGSASPSERYHLAAQAAIPLLTALSDVNSHAIRRDIARTRFQLDAPIVAGKPFFEMVTFMLEELKDLAVVAHIGDLSDYALYDRALLQEELDGRRALSELPSRSRYRYVAELYLAALLYYSNRYGDTELEAVGASLFSWAYSLRVKHLRVQFRSIDNHARSFEAPFIQLRSGASPASIAGIVVEADAYQPDHESTLTTIVNGVPRT